MKYRIVYIVLLFLMLFFLYLSGKIFQRKTRLLSMSGLFAIIVYTLNEGLRFGRGLDYNLYMDSYTEIAKGWGNDKEFLFNLICKSFQYIHIPYQGLIIFMSFMFIVGVLFLMKQYKEVIPLALPLLVLFSLASVENMIRWYLGVSIFLIGLSSFLESGKITGTYIMTSLLAILIHTAIIPIPIIFILVSYIKKPMLPPIFSIILFLSIYLLFKVDYMLYFEDVFNKISFLSASFEKYGDERAEYWLTGGFAGNEVSGKIGLGEMGFLFVLVIFGYRALEKFNHKYIFAYNIFLLGLFLLPISKKIELLIRFDQVFLLFKAIILSCILYVFFIEKKIKCHWVVLSFVFMLVVYDGARYFVTPFKSNPKKYLYVWNKGNETSYSMLQIWLTDSFKNSQK